MERPAESNSTISQSLKTVQIGQVAAARGGEIAQGGAGPVLTERERMLEFLMEEPERWDGMS